MAKKKKDKKKKEFPKICIFEGCDNPVYAKGYCNKHYQKYRLRGEVYEGYKQKKPRKKRKKYIRRKEDDRFKDEAGDRILKKHKKHKNPHKDDLDESKISQEKELKKYIRLKKKYLETDNVAKLPMHGRGGYYRKVNPIKYNDAVIKTIELMRKINYTNPDKKISFSQAANELTKLRMDEKEPFSIGRMKIDRLPLRMKRLLPTMVQHCLAHPNRYNRLTDENKSSFIFTYANMDLYYYFNNRDKMLFFRKPFKCNITLYLSEDSYAPIGEYCFILQKLLLTCFILLDIVPDSRSNKVAKYYFTEFNTKIGNVKKRKVDHLSYDLELEELSNAELSRYLENHIHREEITEKMYEFNRRKKEGSYKARTLRITNDIAEHAKIKAK